MVPRLYSAILDIVELLMQQLHLLNYLEPSREI